MKLLITPEKLCGEIAAPPSKSAAHRLIIASFLSGERTRVSGAGASEDVLATLGALSALGLEWQNVCGDYFLSRKPIKSGATAYCKESGSTLRFLLPIAAALGASVTFTGEEGLLKRPINGLIEPLNRNGAQIEGLMVKGKLKSGDYIVDASISSQYITGLLFALPLLDGDSRIIFKNGAVSKGYIDITIAVLNLFGVRAEKTEYGYFINGGQKYVSPKTVNVEGDYSGAAFFLAAGAIGDCVKVGGLDRKSLQGDSAILSVLKDFGAEVDVEENSANVRKNILKGIEVDIDPIPDLAQNIAVVAAFAEGKSVLKNVGRLKIKESDRVKAIIDMLKVAGIDCHVEGNDLVIIGGKPHGGVFEGGNDHRTVMSSAILACFSGGASTVSGAEAVNKSYPDFIKDLIKLGGRADVGI
ncbi:MAG: 3-phosphoshikimate 1-carboxyvinyltransferase [Clostridia bacterium]|nr:3-phosphoshikimate 1-carboxyvinyltransferase [Clostridia bacterium]